MRHVRLGLILAGLGALGLGLWTQGCLFSPDNCTDLLVCPSSPGVGGGSSGVTSGNGGFGGGSGGFAASTTSSADVGSSTSSGDFGACTTAADCAGTSTLCGQYVCLTGHCALQQLQGDGPSFSQLYGDCHQAMCAQAKLVLTVTDKDVYDDANPCTKDTCEVGAPSNLPQLGLPCGANGVCSAKGTCVACVNDGTCGAATPKCISGYCSALGCQSGGTLPDGTETDVDCGGPDCKPCGAGQICKVASDCTSKVCQDPFMGAPTKQCMIAVCTDGVQNGSETDVDCGGSSCPASSACDDTKHCAVASDCKSGVCKLGTCQSATCNDGVKNGTETGVDCGAVGCVLAKCPGT
jgi:hypothetical protein